MARLTNNLINRPNLINFVRQFCAPFQLMIRVHATWHVSSSPRARSRPRFPVSSLRANQFLPNENWLSGIRGTSPSFDASIEWPSFFPPVRIFDFFFFFRFRHREQGVKTKSNFYHRSPVDEIVNAQLYNRGQFLSRTINFGILLLLLM